MLVDVNGETVFVETSTIPDYLEYYLGPDFWLGGRKYITYMENEVLHFSVFDSDIAHSTQAFNKMGDSGKERVLTAGFTHIDDGELEAYGYSSSLKPTRHSKPQDSIILKAIVEHIKSLEQKPKC